MPTGSTCRSTRPSQSDLHPALRRRCQVDDSPVAADTAAAGRLQQQEVDGSVSGRVADEPFDAEDPLALAVFHPEHRRPGRDRPLGPTPLDETAGLEERIAGRREVGHDDDLARRRLRHPSVADLRPRWDERLRRDVLLTDVQVVGHGNPGREVGRRGDRHRRRCRHGRLGRVGGQDGTRRKRGHRNPDRLVGVAGGHEHGHDRGHGEHEGKASHRSMLPAPRPPPGEPRVGCARE